jgi:hypothetical protein
MLNLYSNSNSKRPFAGLRGANTWFAPIESIHAALRHQAESSSGQRPTGTKIMVTNSTPFTKNLHIRVRGLEATRNISSFYLISFSCLVRSDRMSSCQGKESENPDMRSFGLCDDPLLSYPLTGGYSWLHSPRHGSWCFAFPLPSQPQSNLCIMGRLDYAKARVGRIS